MTAVPPLEDINLFSSDMALQEAMAREGAGSAVKRLAGFGLVTGSAATMERGRLANAHIPALITHDRNGEPAGRVEFHPSYHDLMSMSVSEGLQSAAFVPPQMPSAGAASRQGAYVARAGGLYMAAQVDAGHARSISMTHSGVPALSRQAELADLWLPKISSRSYDSGASEPGAKSSLNLAFAFAESPVRDTATNATVLSQEGAEGGALFALTGVTWSVAAPSSDGLLVLAQSRKGSSLFLVPQVLPDEKRNGVHIRRLNSRLGLRSCALGEVEFARAHGILLGEEGKGKDLLRETILHARLDTVIVVAALMRQALAQAIHFAEHTVNGGSVVWTKPAVLQTLADMALDAEGASALGFRLARAFDRASDERAAAWRRLMTPVSVYWVSRRSSVLAAEAIEVLDASGCAEDWPVARLYRDCPAAAMADGTSTAMALEVLRILQREPEVAQSVMEELGQAAGDDPHLMAAHARIEALLHDPRRLDGRARLLVEALAVLAAGTILRAHGPAAVADAFIMSRMGSQQSYSYGLGLDWAELTFIVRRGSPNQN